MRLLLYMQSIIDQNIMWHITVYMCICNMCVYMCVYIHIYIYTHTHTYIRERGISHEQLAHAVMEAGKSKICKQGWQAGDTDELKFQFLSKGHLQQNEEELMLQVKSKSHLLQNFLLLRRG